MSRTQTVIDLLGSLADHEIARRCNVSESYVRAVRSRYSAPDMETFHRRIANSRRSNCGMRRTVVLKPAAPAKKLRSSGQSREELRKLALILYRMRQKPTSSPPSGAAPGAT